MLANRVVASGCRRVPTSCGRKRPRGAAERRLPARSWTNLDLDQPARAGGRVPERAGIRHPGNDAEHSPRPDQRDPFLSGYGSRGARWFAVRWRGDPVDLAEPVAALIWNPGGILRRVVCSRPPFELCCTPVPFVRCRLGSHGTLQVKFGCLIDAAPRVRHFRSRRKPARAAGVTPHPTGAVYDVMQYLLAISALHGASLFSPRCPTPYVLSEAQ
jgi:hypothetical protein